MAAISADTFSIDQVRNGAPGGTLLHIITVGDLIIVNNHPQIYRVTGVLVGDEYVPPAGDTPATPYTPDQITVTPSFPFGPFPGDEVIRLGRSPIVDGTEFTNLTIFGIPEAWSSLFVWVVPRNDLEVEGAEHVRFTLRSSNDFIIRSPGQATVQISDDDVVMNLVRVQDATEGVSEGRFRITASAPFPRDVRIPYVLGGTATNIADYSDLGNYTTLPAGATSVEIVVNAIEDNIDEGAGESVTLTLSESLDYVLHSTGSSSANPSATLMIFDVAGSVGVTRTQSALLNGNGRESSDPNSLVPVSFTFTMSPAPLVDMSVNFEILLSSTATLGLDYVAPAIQSVVIPGGLAGPSASVDLVIPVLDDTIREGDETIRVRVLNGAAYRVSSDLEAVAVIVDDEPTISIIEPTLLAAAVDGEFTISYATSPARTALQRPVTVTYLIGGSATGGGVDYGVLSGVAIIPANSLSVTIPIIPVGFDGPEPPETVILTVVDNGGPLAGTYDVNGGASAALVTIMEPPPDISVTVSTNVDAGQVVTNGGALGLLAALGALSVFGGRFRRGPGCRKES